MTTYFVDNAGSDSNNGTSTGTPWQTIAKLNSFSFAAGDSVLLKCGGIWREQWNVKTSGTAGNPITVDAYSTGPAPEICGTDLLTGWTLNSGSIYQASYTNAITTALLIEDGVIATLVGSLGAIVAAGQFYADDTNHIIYYRAIHSDSPNGHVMEIGGRANCISASNQSYLTINNLHLYGAGGTSGGGLKCAPTTSASSNITINNCEVDHCIYSGVWFSHFGSNAGLDSLTITNNNIHHNYIIGVHIDPLDVSHRFTNVTISGNHIHHNCNTTTGLIGCYVKSTQAPTITNNEIDHNTGSINISGGLYLAGSPNSIVKYNLCHDNHWNNFHFDVHCNGFDCEYNISYGADHQGYMLEEHVRSDGTSLLTHNLSFNDVSALYFGPGLNTHQVTGVTVVNNLFVQGNGKAVGIDCTNGGLISDNFDNTVDYNVYSISSGHLGHTVNPDANYDTLAAWQALTGWDTHSQNVDPNFANYQSGGTGNYHLAKGSAAIGAGIATSSDPSTDYDGNAMPSNGRYDIGPYAFKPVWASFMA